MHYLYLDSLNGRRFKSGQVAAFYWCEAFHIKAKILDAPDDWMQWVAQQEQLPNQETVQRSSDGELYVWLHSARAPEYDNCISAIEYAHRLVVPPGIDFVWAGYKSSYASFGLWVELEA